MNHLNLNLKDMTVIMDKKHYKDKTNEFICKSGFGCSPNTNGTKIFGRWLSDNTEDCVRGEFVKALKK